MNVDVQNFSEVRNLIRTEKLIQKSEFISFDLEFAGLKFQGNDRDRSQYLPSQKYQKMSAVARKYCIMQVGVTFFIPSQNKQQITAYPFNFYVFPRPTAYSEPTISMQSGCVTFNIANKMDWNRWIEKGITYMKVSEFQKISDIQEKSKKFEALYNYLEQDNKKIIDQVINEIKAKQAAIKKDKNFVNQEDKLYEIATNSFNYVKKVIEKYIDENQKLYTVKYSEQDLKNREQQYIEFKIISISQTEKQRLMLKKSEQLFGFTLLFQQIWNSGKPFIGHNFFFDILFIYEAFIAALPYDYNLFKKIISELDISKVETMKSLKPQEIVQETRRRIFYDTKLISKNLNFKFKYFKDSTSLQSIYLTFNSKEQSKRKIKLHKDFERYDLKNQILHQAGFDSYLTGWVYYQLAELALKDGINIHRQYKGQVNLNLSYFYIDLQNFNDGLCQYQLVFYIQVVQPNKYVDIAYIQAQRSSVLKSLKQILNQEGIAKDILLHEGLKQVFIQIKQQKNFKKITALLVKCVKEKKIKDIYSLCNFIRGKNAKEWSDSIVKLANNKLSAE